VEFSGAGRGKSGLCGVSSGNVYEYVVRLCLVLWRNVGS